MITKQHEVFVSVFVAWLTLHDNEDLLCKVTRLVKARFYVVFWIFSFTLCCVYLT